MPPRRGALPQQESGRQDVGESITKQYRDFNTGLVRAGSRGGLPETALWDSINAQVIGPGQIQTLPAPAPPIATLGTTASIWGVMLNLGGSEAARLIAVLADGSIVSVNPATGATTTICAAGVMSAATRLAVWRDTHVLFIDPTHGYASWDGTTFVQYPATFTATLTSGLTTATWTGGTPASALIPGMGLSGTGIASGTTVLSVVGTTITLSNNATASGSQTLTVGTAAPTSGRAIAVFEARVWIVTGTRGITFSGPGSFTTFETAYAGGVTTLTDPIFVGQITQLYAAIGILWVIGPDAINTITNVQVAGGITTFQNDNLVAGAGTPYADSVQALFRTLIFLSPPGVYAILGATPQKLSDTLDSLFPGITGVTSGPAGVFHLTNLSVYAVLVNLGGVTRILIYSRPTWLIGSQGDSLVWITTLVRTDGTLQLWATDGTHLFQCFAGATGDYDVAFKLFDYDEITRKKTVRRFLVGVEVLGSELPNMAVYLENETTSLLQTAHTLSTEITWVNTSGGAITWVNNSAGPITWIAQGRITVYGESEFSGNLVSMRCRGTGSAPLIIALIAWEVGATGEWVVI